MGREDRHVGHMVPSFALDEPGRSSLAQLLGDAIGSDRFVAIERLLVGCSELQYSLSLVTSTKTEVKTAARSITNHLEKVLLQLEGVDPADELLFDSFYYEANKRDDLLIDLSFESHDSGFYELVDRLRRGAQAYQDAFPAAGKGRTPDQTYTESLTRLRDGFLKIFPEHKFSDQPETVSYRLVQFWLGTMMSKDITDPSRHIRKVIEQVRN